MRRENSKIRAYKPRVKLNIGAVIFLFIFIYIFVYVVIYMTKSHISIYEVVEKSLSENNNFVGVAIREEEVIDTKEAGYITYYVSNGEKVAADSMVFSIDEGGTAYKELKRNLKDADISNDDYISIRNEINYFKRNYNDSNFGEIYNFETDLTNTILDVNTSAVFNNTEELINSVGTDKFVTDKSNKSGIVSYLTDKMSDLTVEDIGKESFDKLLYTYDEHKSGDLLEKNSPAYRLITNENWQIVILLNSDQYDTLKKRNTVGVTFAKDNFSTIAGVEVMKKDSECYAVLSLSRYMDNYIDERYIDIELSINTASGLKIPNSSLIDKEFYVIPSKTLTTDEKSDTKGVMVVKYDTNGKEKNEFIKTQIYYKMKGEDGLEYVYISKNLFDEGTVIKIADSSETITITKRETLKGVYNVNKGYCEFKKVDILYSNSEYSIVQKESEYGLAKFDHIVLDAESVDESDIIY